MTTNTAGAVSEEMVLAALNAQPFIKSENDFPFRVYQFIEHPNEEAVITAALEAALGVSGWRPIDSSSRSDDLYYYPPTQGLPAVIQVGRTGLRRPATHCMPSPPPPATEEG